MGRKLKLAVRFLTDRKYREDLPWVQKIADGLSFFNQDEWTSFRFPGYFIVKASSYLNLWLMLGSFIFLLLTDIFDGLVARRNDQQNGSRGAIMDAVADKCFILPLIADWGYALSATNLFIYELVAMLSIELSNLLLPLLERKGFVKSGMLYKHHWTGKVKFILQGFLGGLLLLGNFIFPGWLYREISLHALMIAIMPFAILSVVSKIKRLRSLYSK
jgi:phosphatidylglycerophosphate synthase